ncbi:hypothetical protein B0J11DRAFT_108603 [Dendryphion nanum]|uniref:CFEM domain-containing protein n=1 Tax=Dendryphion nanum TaxID=256645 RepID=A0A9P9DDC0_9PLEO|nr:hypothetical protein B0J11DRAFT_108603 [Dendryphion nanum]
MKTFAAILALGAGLTVAQDIGGLPACGQTCINNMIAIANSAFGCAAGDITCYCTNANFGYGVRDCSNQACSSQQEANRVIQFGASYCQSIVASAGSTNAALSTGALPVLTSALGSAGASATGSATGSGAVTGSGTTGALASATGSAASRASSALSSANSALSSVTGSAASAASSALSSGASAASSALGSGASAASSAAASVSGLISSILSGASSRAASATQSPAAAPKITGLPVAGAAVGLAAWLLI